ncbi:MAG: response regulator [Clostridiales bacterium]|jgi:two-component system response regulator YesN|nr:response regulator [Clostridiales bacterium]
MLVVDNEPDERMVVSYLLKEYHYEFEVIEAENGRDALRVLRDTHIDVLFTDVKMPHINGIELSKRARAQIPDIQIVFFSGFDDFTFVKSALSVQAVDYLLKPIVPEDFNAIISILQKRLEEARARCAIQKNSATLREKYLVNQLLRNIPPERIRQYDPQADFRFLEKYDRLLLLHFDETFFERVFEQVFESGITAAVTALTGERVTLVNINPSQSVLLAGGADERRLARAVCGYISENWGAVCYVAVTEPFQSLGDLYHRYLEAESWLESRFFDPARQVCGVQDGQQAPLLDLNKQNQNYDDEILCAMANNIKYKDSERLQNNVLDILNRYSVRSDFSQLYIRVLCANILRTLHKGLSPCLPGTSREELEMEISSLFSLTSYNEIKGVILRKLEKVTANFTKGQQSASHVITRVIAYIHGHYMEEISLQILSQVVYLSPRYLSSLFIAETGCGINRYLKKVRMEKARELLTTSNMRIHSICAAVGYTKVSYFCQSFQDEFGVTPGRYRKDHVCASNTEDWGEDA